jgi:hypothetical protein
MRRLAGSCRFVFNRALAFVRHLVRDQSANWLIRSREALAARGNSRKAGLRIGHDFRQAGVQVRQRGRWPLREALLKLELQTCLVPTRLQIRTLSARATKTTVASPQRTIAISTSSLRLCSLLKSTVSGFIASLV